MITESAATPSPATQGGSVMMIRRYNKWSGNPSGTPEDPARCVKEIWPNERGAMAHRYQCSRKRGHGPDGLYCKQHSPDAQAARKAEQEARYRRQTLGFQIESLHREVSATARAMFRQQASMDELEATVIRLEKLIAERDAFPLPPATPSPVGGR